MHDTTSAPVALAPIVAGPAALAAAIETAKIYAAASKAKNTRRAYSGAWKAFVAWCQSRGLDALPAAAESVAVYLAERADQGAKPASLDLYLAAVSEAHRAAGHPSPRDAAPVRAVRSGIRRTHGTAQQQKAPATVDTLRRMIASLPAGVLGARDAALLLLGFSAALRRSELVGLDVNDITFTVEGAIVALRRSKVDQEGAGRSVAVPFASCADVCPVRRLRAWLDVAGISQGAIFRAVNRHGRVAAERLSDRAVALVVKRSVEKIGLDAKSFAGHSLRAGLATSAALAGKSERSIMQTTGHKSVVMVRKYIRTGEIWRDNAAAGLL